MAKKTWREKATADAIKTKMSRKKNPVTSLVSLAMEFGAPVAGPYFTGKVMTSGRTASSSFRTHVKSTIGQTGYKNARDDSQVRV